MLDNRYKIIHKLTKGSFGHIYLATDLKNEYGSVVCKINKDKMMNELEAKVLKLLQEQNYDNFPKLRSHGVMNNKPYIIMERLGQTLEH